MKYNNNELYFAIDNTSSDEMIVIIAPKEKWDEDGDIQDDFSSRLMKDFPDFLSPEFYSKGSFPLTDELMTEEDVRENMLELGYEYNLELQAFFSETQEDEDDEEEFEDDTDGFWKGVITPNYTLN